MLNATKNAEIRLVTPFTVNIVVLSTESISVTFSMQLQTSMSHCKLTNVAFHWLASEYTQLASGFMQLAAALRIGATKHIFVFLKGKCL